MKVKNPSLLLAWNGNREKQPSHLKCPYRITMPHPTSILHTRVPPSSTHPPSSIFPLPATHALLASIPRSPSIHPSKCYPSFLEITVCTLHSPASTTIPPSCPSIDHQYCSSNFKNPSFRRSRRSSSSSPIPRRLQIV